MSDVRRDLVRIGKTLGRAKRAHEHAREEAHEAIRRAHAEEIGPAEITKLLGHELTERTVFRILGNGKPKPPSS